MDDRLREFEPMLQAIVSKYFAPGFDRDDLLQEARIGAWGGLRDFRPGQGTQLRTFVSFCAERMVQSAVIAARRRKHEHLNHAAHLDAPVAEGGLTLSDLVSDVGQDPFEQISLRDELRSIVEQLNDGETLTELERAAILGVAEGRSYDEIREPLQASRKQIDNAVGRARRKLREPAPVPDARRRLALSPLRRRQPCSPRRKEPRRMTALEAVRTEISQTEEERDALDRRLETLHEAEQLLASLDDQTTPPPVEEPKPKPAKPKSKPAARRAARVNEQQVGDPADGSVNLEAAKRAAKSDGLSNAEIGRRNAEQVITLMNQHPGGLDVNEVAEKLGRSTQSVGKSLNKATREQKLDVKRLGEGPKAKRVWFPLSPEVAAADSNGARTDLERRVLDTLNGSGLTTEEVQKNLDGINFRVAGEVCAALARRGVIDRRETPGGRILWSRAA